MYHLLPHYANKYGLENVECSEDKLRAYCNGKLVLSLKKDGAGNLSDEGEILGLEDRHDLAPIPKDSRIWKRDPKSGALVKDERAAEREQLRAKFSENGRVLSCEKLEAKKIGWKFDEKQQVLQEPAK